VAVDCGALPPNLLESELFGYVKGAFTGAIKDRQGLIEEADGGSLFLDEFTNMSLETQAKLLRVIQEGEIRPIGSNQIKKVDVRIIVAASSDLTEKVASGVIRSDLFYRLNVVSIPIPPLRERVEDIPTLSELFVTRYAKKHGKNVKQISPETMQILEHYTWPGNIRELENVIERAVVMMHFEETDLLPKHLPQEVTGFEPVTPFLKIPTEGDLSVIIDDYERQVLETALRQHHWNKMATARALNTSDTVIRYKMNRLGIIAPE
jgi:transcriptional regulator with PAS, ATPase and Fis domain